MSEPDATRRTSTSGMKSDWEVRAQANALHSIASDRVDWDEAEFYKQGCAIVETVVDPVLLTLGVDPASKRVLEIGCGVGRLFEGYAERFGDVWGIDISPTMIKLGQEKCPATATWLVGDGATLTGVADHSIDHVVSYEVFQHIPSYDVIASYFAEIDRVLVDGGTFQVQLRKASDSLSQAAVRALPRGVRVRVGALLQRTGILTVGGDVDSWLGCIVAPAKARELATSLGFTDLAVLPDSMHSHHRNMGYWLIGRR